MKPDIVAKCENLFALAQKRGERSTSYDSKRGEDEMAGCGTKNDRTHHTFQSGTFTIKATQNEWARWDPSSDTKETRYELEIRRGSKIVFLAQRNGARHEDFFSGDEERFQRSRDTEPSSWKVSRGRMPVKYLKE